MENIVSAIGLGPAPAVPARVKLDDEYSDGDDDDFDYSCHPDDEYLEGDSDGDYVLYESDDDDEYAVCESDDVVPQSLLKKRKISEEEEEEEEGALAKKEAVHVQNKVNFVTMSTSIQSEQLLSEETNKGDIMGKQAIKMEKKNKELVKGQTFCYHKTNDFRPKTKLEMQLQEDDYHLSLMSLGRARQPGRCRWGKPRKGWYRVDTYGISTINRGGCPAISTRSIGGCGAIIRDHEGTMIAAASGISDKKSFLYNEVQGVKLGLILAKKKGLKRVKVTTVSRYIYKHLTDQRELLEEDDDTSIVKPVFDEIRGIMPGFESVLFRISFRATNRAADYLAKLFKKNDEIKPGDLEVDKKLMKIIRSDAQGVEYNCWF